MFCVVIYVLYNDIVHKMSLQRERERDFRLLKKKKKKKEERERIPEVLSIF